MNKMKRKVTVDTGKAAPEEGGRRKPSVFDRLGPGAARKSFGEYEDSDSDREAYVQKCRNWLLQGTCPYGSKCKFQHGPFSGGTKSKGKREDDSSDDLRLRVKGRKDKGDKNKDSDSEGSTEAKRSHSRGKKEKESRIKSAAVVVKPGGHTGGSEVDVGSTSHWSGEELDYKKELELEKKRQQIQKELLRLEDEEDTDARENFTIQRQVPSSGSEVDEPRRSRSATKRSTKQSPSKKKTDKKKGKLSKSPVKAKQRSPSPKLQERYTSDSEDHHKTKHKKKGKGSGSKKRLDSPSDEEKNPEPRKLVSPLKLKVKAQPALAKSTLFQSETDEEMQPVVEKQQKRSRSFSSEEDRPKSQKTRGESLKGKSKQQSVTVTPVKKKKAERRDSPEAPPIKTNVKATVKSKHGKGKGHSVSTSRDRSRSVSPEVKKVKKVDRKKKAKKDSSEEGIGKISSFEKMRTPEPMFDRGDHDRDDAKVREDTPMSDYSKARDFSPGPEPVKKKKEKKKQKKLMKEREASPVKEDYDFKHKKQKDKIKERERSESPASRYSQKPDKRSESHSRAYKKDTESKARSPAARGSNRDTLVERQAKSPEPSYRQSDRSSPSRIKEFEGSVYGRKDRELRDRDSRGERDFDRDRERDRERDHDDYRRTGRMASPADREGRSVPGSGQTFRGEGPPPHGRDSGVVGHRGDFERPEPAAGSDSRRDRYQDYREERRDRYDERFPQAFDESRGRFERDQRGAGYDRERGQWGRQDREGGMDRDRFDRDRFQQQPGEQRYGQEGAARGRGRDQFEYRDNSWDRSRGRGYGNQTQRGQAGQAGQPGGWGRGGNDRGRFEERPNRRSEWESGRRTDEFYVPDQRRDWQDRRDDRRDVSRDESREGRRGDRPGPDRDNRRDDRDRRIDDRRMDRRDERRDDDRRDDRRDDDRREDRHDDERRDEERREGRRSDERGDDDRPSERDRRDGSAVRPRGQDDSEDRGAKRDDNFENRVQDRSEERGRRGRERDRNRSRDQDMIDDERSVSDTRTASRDEKGNRSRSRDRKSRRKDDTDIDRDNKGVEVESKNKEERSREVDDKDNKDRGRDTRDRSRKRPLSVNELSPVHKRARDGSPAVSVGSFRSNRDQEPRGQDRSRSAQKKDQTRHLDDETEKPCDTQSEAASEKSHSASLRSDSRRSRSQESRSRRKQSKGEGRQSPSLERSSLLEPKKCSPKSHDGRMQLEEEDLTLKMVDKKRSRSLDAYDMEEDSKRRKTDDVVADIDAEKEGSIEETDKKDDDAASDLDEIASQHEKTFESIEQNFSDWSDDSDLDILNQPDQSPPTPPEAVKEVPSDELRQRRSPSRSSLSSRHSHGSRRDRGTSQGSRQAGQDKTVEKGDDLDLGGAAGEEGGELESISSEEGLLEQADDTKPAAVDALALDWESLPRNTKSTSASGSALLRFRAGNVFARIGVSRQFAGEDLFKEVSSACQRHQEGEETVSTEEKKEGEKTDTKFSFLHNVASLHSALKQKQNERKTLLSTLGPFRRSLCANRDLEMRRQLCKVDKVLDHSQIYPGQELDTELCKESLRLFRQTGDQTSGSQAENQPQATAATTQPEIACP